MVFKIYNYYFRFYFLGQIFPDTALRPFKNSVILKLFSEIYLS